jgi:hypothetical protein
MIGRRESTEFEDWKFQNQIWSMEAWRCTNRAGARDDIFTSIAMKRLRLNHDRDLWP